MKIICNCGAKFAVDITPEMIQRPIQFVCPSCGLDSSASVNEQIRREAAAMGIGSAPQPSAVVVSVTPSAPAPAPVAPPAPVAAAPAVASVPVPPSGGPRLGIARSAPVAAEAAPAQVAGQTICHKHPGEAITSECLVCKKPMCPKCMELFGYICSPFCRSRAEAQKMKIPTYAGQKSVVEANLWRKVGLVVGAIGAVIAALIGGWIWFEYFGSRPHPIYTVSIPGGIDSGQSAFCGPDQIVLLNGTALSRYDIKGKRQVWSHELITEKDLSERIAASTKEAEAEIKQAKLEGWERIPSMPSADEIRKGVMMSAAYSMHLYTYASNIWVSTVSGKLAQYEWATGDMKKEVPFEIGYREASRDGENLIVQNQNELGQKTLKRLNLTTAEVSVETYGEPKVVATAKAGVASPKNGAASAKNASATVAVTGNSRKPLDAAAVAAQAQRLPYAAKLALPALAANAMHQERIEDEMQDMEISMHSGAEGEGPKIPKDRTHLFPSKNGFYQMQVHLLEEKIVEIKVMKDAPKKSALDGDVNASKTMEIANELLNEMQRNRGGGTELEDQSRYLVTLHSMDGKTPDWSGEVSGPPSFFALKSVNVIAAGTTVLALDKSNKKLWQASVTYALPRRSYFDEDESRYGAGPCVEHGDCLYVADPTVLTCFELTTGNVQWRLPSVGIAGMLFDDHEMLYVNTTTANPENVKFSRQIDVSQKVNNIIVKVDPKTGKTLWTANEGGFISYLSGKFIYIASWRAGSDEKEESPIALGIGGDTSSYLRIKRVNPSNGKLMFDYYQKRGPRDVKFDGKMIQLVYKNELQVLSYLTF